MGERRAGVPKQGQSITAHPLCHSDHSPGSWGESRGQAQGSGHPGAKRKQNAQHMALMCMTPAQRPIGNCGAGEPGGRMRRAASPTLLSFGLQVLGNYMTGNTRGLCPERTRETSVDQIHEPVHVVRGELGCKLAPRWHWLRYTIRLQS